ncbi:MAG TPA: YchJ family metal-binding protein, partial [Actinomycetales bacterium]
MTVPSVCPCGSGAGYESCCCRLHRGEGVPATAEQLMRSRFSAFAVGDAAYLGATWHPSTRPS